jgi:hypothetical protein
MNTPLRRLGFCAVGFLMLAALSACLVPTGGEYVAGGYYEGPGYVYGGWGAGYHVGPSRGGDRRSDNSSPRAYRAAPRTRPTPSIPTHSRPHPP